MRGAYLGEIRLMPCANVPPGWAPCDGQVLRINDHVALFSVLRDRYGGDGRTTFALPDLRGRTPIGSGKAVMRSQEDQEQVAEQHLVLAFCIAVEGLYPSPH